VKVRFDKDLSEPVDIPQAGIDRAIEILRSGRLFRYGEFSGGESEVAALERDFADYMNRKYAVAVNSCGAALFVALKSIGVVTGDEVLVNAFTLAPVPGAVEHAGAQPLLVECDENCCINLDDLSAKISTGVKVLLLSHMRGHIADMGRIQDMCARNNVILLEDCAHTLGARWNGRLSGSFGHVSCFSLQSFKHINAGEGGIIVTDNADVAAKAILYSGSYMLYEQNGARPPIEAFEKYRYQIPNFSLRMQEITAAVARPQLVLVEQRQARWARCYQLIVSLLADVEGIRFPSRGDAEDFVPSSLQFSLPALSATSISRFISICKGKGVDIKWFGASEPAGFTSTPAHWRYIRQSTTVDTTLAMLSKLCDLRLPQSLTDADCRTLAHILSESLTEVHDTSR